MNAFSLIFQTNLRFNWIFGIISPVKRWHCNGLIFFHVSIFSCNENINWNIYGLLKFKRSGKRSVSNLDLLIKNLLKSLSKNKLKTWIVRRCVYKGKLWLKFGIKSELNYNGQNFRYYFLTILICSESLSKLKFKNFIWINSVWPFTYMGSKRR